MRERKRHTDRGESCTPYAVGTLDGGAGGGVGTLDGEVGTLDRGEVGTLGYPLPTIETWGRG